MFTNQLPRKFIVEELYQFYNSPLDLKSNMGAMADRIAYGIPSSSSANDSVSDGTIKIITKHRFVRKVLLDCDENTLKVFSCAFNTRRVSNEIGLLSKGQGEIAQLLMALHDREELDRKVARQVWLRHKNDLQAIKELKKQLDNYYVEAKDIFDEAIENYLHNRRIHYREKKDAN